MANPNPVHKFKKGESGNPGGRPKKAWTMAGLIEEELEKALKDKQGNSQIAKQMVAKRLIYMAIDGDLGAIKEINDRVDGKPLQRIGGDKDNPLNTITDIIIKDYGAHDNLTAETEAGDKSK